MKIKTKNAIEKAGSNKALADLLRVSKGAVSLWGEFLPAERAEQLVEARPDWFPDHTTALLAKLTKRIESIGANASGVQCNVA